MIAGLSFLPLLKKAAMGELPILRGVTKELSQAEIARFNWPPGEQGAEINYQSRLNDRQRHGLRKYYPVAHLVAAFQYMARERSAFGAAAAIDYQDAEFWRELVRRANGYAGNFAAMPKWQNIASALVRIEWRE